MITQTQRNEIRKRIHSRIRAKLSGTTERPRLRELEPRHFVACHLAEEEAT